MERGQLWNEKEIEIVKNTSRSLDDICLLIPNRSKESIRIKSNKLGYHRSGDALLRNSSNYVELLEDKEFCQVIDGELLGDGCITRQNLRNKTYYIFTYQTVNEQYARYLHSIISQKIKSLSKVYIGQNKKVHYINNKLVVNNVFYALRFAHKVFQSFYNRWYISGHKKVPCDLLLSPTICLHWYIGDGTICARSSSVITLCTQSFKENEIDFLIQQLNSIGLRATKCLYNKLKQQFIMRIICGHALNFLSFIGQSPVTSYAYKWDTNGYQKHTSFCPCGQVFYFYACSNRWKQYCSEKCRILYKNRRNYLRRKHA